MNLQNTLEYIASVAQNHPLINSSYVGSIYDLNSNTNTKYAVFAIEDIDVTKQSNSLIYNCYLYVVDRVMNDESNTIAVQTMAVNTLQEIINYIEGYSQSLEVSGSYIITPIRQKFSDECAGAYVQLRLVSQNDIGECAFSDDKVVEIFQGKTYLLDNYFTKSETLTLLDGKQDTLIAGDNITIVDNVISATGGGGGDSVWEKDANNNIFPKGNTNVSGTNCFVTGLTSKATKNNNISIGYNNESRANNSIVIGVGAKDFDPSGDELGWLNLIAIGNNPVIPPKSLNTSYATWQNPKFIVGGLYGLNRFNTLEQTINGDLYIRGINGWTGTNATPDGVSHLQGYLSGLNTRITDNTTAIGNKQNTLTAGENIEIENDVISVPHDVTLENIQSPSDNTVIGIYSNPGQTRDNIYITAWGNSSDSQISMEGSGSDNESSSIAIEAYGYSDSNIQLRGGRQDLSSTVNIYASGYSDSVIEMTGGTESDNKSLMLIAANGSTETAEIQMKGGDDDNMSVVNVNSEQFLYNDNDVAVVPINSPFVNGSIIYPENNHIYNGTNIASLTINGTNFTGDCLVQFTTGSTTPSITISGLVFDVLPTFNVNKYYELGIHNGHCLWVEYDS